jgi:hypothetical protein
MGMIRVEMTSAKYPGFWKLAYAYEDYLTKKYGRPSRMGMTSNHFREFFKDELDLQSVVVESGSRFGTFYLNEKDYMWFSLKFL